MAVYNEILSGRFNRALQKLLSMKGPPPTPQLSSEIMPILPLFFGVENRYLEGWQRYGVFAEIAGVVANVSGFRLRNPPGSGVVAVIEKIVISATNTGRTHASVGNVNVDLAALVGTGFSRFDARGPVTPSLVATSQNTTVSIADLQGTIADYSLGTVNQSADLILTDDQEIPVLPGDAVQTIFQGVNTALNVSIMWRERNLEDSEKS